MLIRPYEPADRDAVVGLWRDCGLTRPWNNPDLDIDRKLADSPWGLLVGTLAGASQVPRATMMVGYDGHRGSVYYLAVDPVLQRQGFGSAMMDHAEALLRARGCPKLNLFVRGENAAVISFYTARGYQLSNSDEMVTMGLRLIPD